MFLSLYCGLKAIFKDCDIVGFALPYDSPERYAFELLPWDGGSRLLFSHRLHRVPLLAECSSLLGRFKQCRGKIGAIDRALREADAIFDASGYNLGSGWSKQVAYSLLSTIKVARQYNKPIVLMPQSFGPFDWDGKTDVRFLRLIRAELTYPVRIFARERQGYDCLASLGLNNIAVSADMVIREKCFPLASDVYASATRPAIDFPDESAVGCILNENVFRIGTSDAARRLYARIIDKLVDDGEKVYILRTSSRDVGYIATVLNAVKNAERVRVIGGEYSSPELIDIMKRFKYVIASRYHSIIFGYRNGVPAIMLGWASKYKELAQLMEQEEYVVDIRDGNTDIILEKMRRMREDHGKESTRIRKCLKRVQATSVVQEAVQVLGLQ